MRASVVLSRAMFEDPFDLTLGIEAAAAVYAEWARTQSEEHFRTVGGIMMLAFDQRWDELWAITLRSIELTPFEDGLALSVIAAGPLEDLVRYAAPVMKERFAAEIRRDPKFRRTLSGVWAREEQPEFWNEVLPLLREYPTDSLD